MLCPIIFLRIGRVPRPQIAVHREVMTISCELLHSSLLNLILALLLARSLGSVFPFTLCGKLAILVNAHPTQAPYIRARSLLPSTPRSIAAMRPSPSYVLAALYLLGDTNARRWNPCLAGMSELLTRQEERIETTIGRTYFAGAGAAAAAVIFSRSCSLR
jgi:hypothetical protein